MDNEISQIADHLKSSYFREIQILRVFGYFRERLLLGIEVIPGIEMDALNEFYSNERFVLDALSSHPSNMNFLY